MVERDEYGFRKAPSSVNVSAPKTTSIQKVVTAIAPVRPVEAPVRPAPVVKTPVSAVSRISGVQKPAQQQATVSPAFQKSAQQSVPTRVTPQPQTQSQVKPKRQGGFGASLKKKLNNFRNFVAKRAGIFAVLIVGGAGVAYVAKLNEKAEDQRERLSNSPESGSQMKNGMNQVFKGWKGAISEITGGDDIDTGTLKDGLRRDSSVLMTGPHAGTSGPNIGNTLTKGAEVLPKYSYKDGKRISSELNAPNAYTVNLQTREDAPITGANKRELNEPKVLKRTDQKQTNEQARIVAAKRANQGK